MISFVCFQGKVKARDQTTTSDHKKAVSIRMHTWMYLFSCKYSKYDVFYDQDLKFIFHSSLLKHNFRV